MNARSHIVLFLSLFVFAVNIISTIEAAHSRRFKAKNAKNAKALTAVTPANQAQFDALCALKCAITNWPGTRGNIARAWTCTCDYGTSTFTATQNPCDVNDDQTNDPDISRFEYERWTGISCDLSADVNTVTSLNLPNYGFIGTLPTSFSGLSELTFMDLGKNSLSSTIPTQISTFSKLKKLYLDNNQFTGALGPEVCISTVTTNLLYLGGTNTFTSMDVCVQAIDTAGCGTALTPTYNCPMTFTSGSTYFPTATPTASPTFVPTESPTEAPTAAPTTAPTNAPTAAPTYVSTYVPTASPSFRPTTKRSTMRPTVSAPSKAPSKKSSKPTIRPTRPPTASPSRRKRPKLI